MRHSSSDEALVARLARFPPPPEPQNTLYEVTNLLTASELSIVGRMLSQPPRSLYPAYACTAFALEAQRWSRRLCRVLGIGRPQPYRDDTFAKPNSELCQRAEERATAAYDPHLLGHCRRTWAYAQVVGLHLGLQPDPEALYVACLLHALGLTAQHAGPECFEVRGARAAHAVCLPDKARADIVHDAILLRTSITAAFSTPEIRLVQAGSGCDLIGLDRHLVHPYTHQEIQKQWPKDQEFAPHVLAQIEREITPHPESPGGHLLRLGFSERMRSYHHS